MWNGLVDRSSRLAFAVVLGVTLLVPGRALAQQLKLDQLDHLASRAKETVHVTLDESMLQAAGGFLMGQNNQPATDSVKSVIAGLKGVYVRTFSFEKPGAYSKDDVESVRSQLKAPWSRIVSVQEKDETVDIYMWQPGGQGMGGMAIVVAEPMELTVVNIVGNVNLANLATIGGAFGIPTGPGTPASPPR